MASQKYRIGLWGCGGRTHALIEKAIKDGRVEISCCYDINAEKSNEVADNLGATAVSSEDELLAFNDVDAFLICLFPGLHAQALLKALPVGKPIYAEKPVATHWEDYNKLLEAAKANKNTMVHVGLMHRYYPVFATVGDVIKSGKIGDVLSMTVNWMSELQPVETFPGGKDNWHFREDTGGELVQHFCHSFDWLRELGGEFTEISALSNHLRDNNIPIEDTWDILLRHESGVLVNFHSSMNNSRGGEMGWVEGTDGTLEWEWNKPSRIKYFARTGDKQQEGEDIPMNGMPEAATQYAFERFIESLDAGENSGPSLNDGLWSTLIPLMARKSADEKKTLSLPARELY